MFSRGVNCCQWSRSDYVVDLRLRAPLSFWILMFHLISLLYSMCMSTIAPTFLTLTTLKYFRFNLRDQWFFQFENITIHFSIPLLLVYGNYKDFTISVTFIVGPRTKRVNPYSGEFFMSIFHSSEAEIANAIFSFK